MIELLVVIALISLLISMLIPSLKRSMDAAESAVCKHNLRQIGYALELYRMENDGWLPSDAPESVSHDDLGEESGWFAKLVPTYLSDPMVLTCPEDPFGFRMAGAAVHLDDPIAAQFASYGMNSFMAGSAGATLAKLDSRQPSRPLDTILLADLGPDRENSSRDRMVTGGPYRNSSLLRWDDGFDPFSQRRIDPWLTLRHGRGINVLTLDGGVRGAQTAPIIHEPMRRHYANCAAGGCTFCGELRLFHYTFAKDHLYWWTGVAPTN